MGEQILHAAIIGCGRMGAFTAEKTRANLPQCWLPLNHAEALISLSGVKLVAVCDKNLNAARAAGQKYGVHVYKNYEEMIKREELDIITIATRTLGRSEIIAFAASNGVRGIHAEKPLARNLYDSMTAIDALRRFGVKFTYGTVRRYMPVYGRAREIVASGEIGELKNMTADFGRTLLLWNHPHMVDLFCFFAGAMPQTIFASMKIAPAAVMGMVIDDDPTVDFASVTFANDITGVITSAGGMNLRLSGTAGEVAVLADGTYLEVCRDNGSGYFLESRREVVPTAMSGTQAALAELCGAVRGENELSLSLDDLLIEQKILMALASSALQGRPVGLDNLDPGLTVTGRFGDVYA